MKKLILCLSASFLALTSFTNESKKENSTEDVSVKLSAWVVHCADGSLGGYFMCDCNQSQANAIAAIMCN